MNGASTDSIQVIADGADGYRLLAENNELVGWVRGRAIGVSGFASVGETAAAAIRSYGVLAVWLERQHLHPLADMGDGTARMIHDGAHRWLLVGRTPVARLPEGTPYDRSAKAHAFEILLKGTISEGMAIHAALVALRAAHGRIDAADIAWPQRKDTRGVTPPVLPTTHVELEG